ncbi:cytosolic glyceraldehyde-3-phosphate dehydrogenase, partial [Tanacetum coccineum]
INDMSRNKRFKITYIITGKVHYGDDDEEEAELEEFYDYNSRSDDMISTKAIGSREYLRYDKISSWDSVVLTYEPVWATGTGKVASLKQAEECYPDPVLANMGSGLSKLPLRLEVDADDDEDGTNYNLPLSIHKVLSNYDLLMEILLRLPIISLHLFKPVCKQWLSLITSPSFTLTRTRSSFWSLSLQNKSHLLTKDFAY